MATKQCSKCKVIKNLEEYPRCSANKDGHKNMCHVCGRTYAKLYGKVNRDRLRERRKKVQDSDRNGYLEKRREAYKTNRNKALQYVDTHKIEFLMRAARRRAKKSGVEFLLSKPPTIPNVCPVFGLPLVLNARKHADPCSMSIDRINPSFGYVDGNVRIISYRANCLKNDSNKEELGLIVGWLKNAPNTIPAMAVSSNAALLKVRRMYTDAKSRSKKRGIPFTVNLGELQKLATELCPVFGIPLDWNNVKKRKEQSPSIERIDSTKGYESGNVVVISWRANRIKKDATLEELVAIYNHGF